MTTEEAINILTTNGFVVENQQGRVDTLYKVWYNGELLGSGLNYSTVRRYAKIFLIARKQT